MHNKVYETSMCNDVFVHIGHWTIRIYVSVQVCIVFSIDFAVIHNTMVKPHDWVSIFFAYYVMQLIWYKKLVYVFFFKFLLPILMERLDGFFFTIVVSSFFLSMCQPFVVISILFSEVVANDEWCKWKITKRAVWNEL